MCSAHHPERDSTSWCATGACTAPSVQSTCWNWSVSHRSSNPEACKSFGIEEPPLFSEPGVFLVRPDGTLCAYLADPGIVATEEMKRVVNLPVGASRKHG